MLQNSRKSPKLFSDFNTLQFASVMTLVVFVLLLAFMMRPTSDGGVSADPPKVSHPVAMPGALREDVMMVTIMRDGRIYFGVESIDPDYFPEKITDRLKERKVYIRADARARYGTVKVALEGVRTAGILRVAFLADQRRVSALR